MREVNRSVGFVDELAEQVGRVPGVVGVLLGGSRARGEHVDGSDYDIGIYYEHPLDVASLREVARRYAGTDAEVTGVGEWGPWVDGGAWLSIGGVAVDWLYRDLDRVQRSWVLAQRGEFEFHAQTGHPLGVPDFAYAGEVALGVVLHDATGRLARLHDSAQSYPGPLADAMVARLSEADFLLAGMRKASARADAVWVSGNVFRVVMLCVHALHARAGRWLINEKGALDSARRLAITPPGFVDAARRIAGRAGTERGELAATMDSCDSLLAATRAAVSADSRDR